VFHLGFAVGEAQENPRELIAVDEAVVYIVVQVIIRSVAVCVQCALYVEVCRRTCDHVISLALNQCDKATRSASSLRDSTTVNTVLFRPILNVRVCHVYCTWIPFLSSTFADYSTMQSTPNATHSHALEIPLLAGGGDARFDVGNGRDHGYESARRSCSPLSPQIDANNNISLLSIFRTLEPLTFYLHHSVCD
jgi:hypothetical protein